MSFSALTSTSVRSLNQAPWRPLALSGLLALLMLGLAFGAPGLPGAAEGKPAGKGETTMLRGLVPLEIDLPKGYTVKSIEGLNFFVHYIALEVPRKDGKFNALGVYVGFGPSHFCKEGEKETTKRPAKIGKWKSEWWDCPSSKTPGAFHREAWLESGYENVTLHVFVSGNEQEEMDLLETAATTLRPVPIKE